MTHVTPRAAATKPSPHGALHLLAEQLEAAPLGPSASFRGALRQRLLAAATGQLAPAVVRRHSPVGRRRRPLRLALRVGVAGIAASVSVTGVAVASERALPGDALYGIKRGTEGLQLGLAGSDVDRGLLHLQFAGSRLSEVRGLVERSGGTMGGVADAAATDRIRATLAIMDEETASGARLLTDAFVAAGSDTADLLAPLNRLVSFTRVQQDRIVAVLPSLPPPAASTSLLLLRDVQVETTRLLTADSAAPGAPPPPEAAPSSAARPSASPAGSAAASPAAPASAAASPGVEPAPAVGSASPSPASSASPSPGGEASPTPSPRPGNASPSATPVSPTPSPVPPSGEPAASASPEPSPSPSSGSARPSTSPSPAPTATPAPTSSAVGVSGPDEQSTTSTGFLRAITRALLGR